MGATCVAAECGFSDEHRLPPQTRICRPALDGPGSYNRSPLARLEDAAAFRPGRFLDVNMDLYSWIPFGGGNRRSPGAAFANMEMQVVLRAILREFQLVPTSARGERWQNKGVSFGPSKGACVVVRRRRHGVVLDGSASDGTAVVGPDVQAERRTSL
jgi:hypothetical protein